MSKDPAGEKENNIVLRAQDKVPYWLKEEKIFKESRDKISNWIDSRVLVGWLRFKNKQAFLIIAGNSLLRIKTDVHIQLYI